MSAYTGDVTPAVEALKRDETFTEEVSSDLLDSWAEHIARTVLDAVQPVTPDREALAKAIFEYDNSAAPSVKFNPEQHVEYLHMADALLPLLGQPRTDAPLDPEPWVTPWGLRFVRNRTDTHFQPEPQYEQDQARYPRTDEEDGR